MTDDDRERWRTIERVLDAALDLPADERLPYVDRVCAGDAALREEIASLLAAHRMADDFLERPVGSVDAFGTDPSPRRIGPYRLVKPLGRGGLGIVYLAVDTRLGRRVALKILRASRVLDPDARARFEREARAASALDHPNVCTIFDVAETDSGLLYIAMAWIQGESLRERVGRGPLPVSEAIDVATQLADGLAHAHDRGVVHRDIKPANVMVTPAGHVQIVDFGLAKWRGAETVTREGVTPGTVAYMSPEQVLGRPVDHRTDIWALGVVLYEMLAGRLPFGGDDDRSQTHAILHATPEPMTALRAGIPIGLEPILAKALAKDPARRYQHVDEVAADLRNVLEPVMGFMPGVAAMARGLSVRTWLLLLVVAVAAGFLGAWVLDRSGEPGSPPVMHLSLTLPGDQELAEQASRRLVISPDGRNLVYAGRRAGREQLYVRALDRLDSRALMGTDGARDPFFSPDGESLAFFADQEIRKVRLDGGAPQKIADAPSEASLGGSWGRDGTLIVSLGPTSGLYRVPDTGGVLEPLTHPDPPARSGHYFPQILPDGSSVLFSNWREAEGTRPAILDLRTNQWTELTQAGCTAARYVGSGHLLCSEDSGILTTGSLLAAPFDLAQHRLADRFVSLARPSAVWRFDLAISDTGTLVYLSRPAPARGATLMAISRDGTAEPLARELTGAFAPAISPDGSRLAVTRLVAAGRMELWLYDLRRAAPLRVSPASTVSNFPVWSPDGQRVVFNSLAEPAGLYSAPVDGSENATPLHERGDHPLIPGSFSPDGRVLAFTELNERTLGDLWTLSLDSGSTTPILQTPANERTPAFSGDGRWLAYASDESGRDEVYVRAYPGSGGAIQVSTDGGHAPVWSRDGTTLFYRRGDAMIAVSVRTDGGLAVDVPVTLVEGRFADEYMTNPNYAILPDGRFLTVGVGASASPVRLDVILNWTEELRRLASVD